MQENEAADVGLSEDLETLWRIHRLAELLVESKDESLSLIAQRIRAITLQATRAQDPWPAG
jgi:hypothetical protein